MPIYKSRRIVLDLDDQPGYSLRRFVFDGNPAGSQTGFPVFDILKADGKREEIPASSPQLISRLSQSSPGRVEVLYQLPELFAAQITYDLADDGVSITAQVISEEGAKLIAVGTALFHLTPHTVNKDFQGVVIPEFSGRLLYFDSTPIPFHYELLQSAKYLANFFALSFRNSGVVVRPQHFSAGFYYGVDQSSITVGTKQFFRPERTEDFSTPLCHNERTLQLLLVTDAPRAQDWRDIALFYRRHFLPANTRKSPLYRDGMTSGSQLHSTYPNFADYLPLASRLDYADLSFWVCAGHCPKFVNLDHLYWDFIPDPTRGDYLAFKRAAALYGWKTSIHQDMDVVTQGRGWNEEYVRRKPDGSLWQEGEWGGRKSYFRSYIAFREEWPRFMNEVFDRWDVQPGDMWHDDVNGWYWWEDYNTTHPSTRDTDLQIRREIWKFCRDQRGVAMSDECLMEGMTDLNDYSHWTFCYETDVNDRIMMLPFLFQGVTYYGFACCESVLNDLRLPPVNFAYVLLAGTKMGITVNKPQYDLFVEPYFKNNLLWSYIADAFVETMEQEGNVYTVTYSNGIRLVSNPYENDFTMTIGGIDYHGYTPVNKRGFMALWRSGSFQLAPGNAVPFHTHYWQSHPETDLAGATTRISPDGEAVLIADTSVSPMPNDTRRYMRARQGDHNLVYLETPDTLVLRRIPAAVETNAALEMTEIVSPENEYRFRISAPAGTEIRIQIQAKGWAARLYTQEFGAAQWTRDLRLTLEQEQAVISFHPYVFGERDE